MQDGTVLQSFRRIPLKSIACSRTSRALCCLLDYQEAQIGRMWLWVASALLALLVYKLFDDSRQVGRIRAMPTCCCERLPTEIGLHGMSTLHHPRAGTLTSPTTRGRGQHQSTKCFRA